MLRGDSHLQPADRASLRTPTYPLSGGLALLECISVPKSPQYYTAFEFTHCFPGQHGLRAPGKRSQGNRHANVDADGSELIDAWLMHRPCLEELASEQ